MKRAGKAAFFRFWSAMPKKSGRLRKERGYEASAFTHCGYQRRNGKARIIAEYVALPDTKLKEKSIGTPHAESLYYAMAMQKIGEVSVTFAGIDNTTGDVLLAGQMMIGLAPGIQTVSSIGLCDIPGFEGSEGSLLAVGDSAVCTNLRRNSWRTLRFLPVIP